VASSKATKESQFFSKDCSRITHIFISLKKAVDKRESVSGAFPEHIPY